MTTYTAENPNRINVKLTACEEWPEANDAYCDAVQTALDEAYPDAIVNVIVQNRASIWAVSYGPAYEGQDVVAEVKAISEDVWEAICSHPEAYGL